MIFTIFVDSDISEQGPVCHTERNVCSTVSKGKAAHVGSLCYFQYGSLHQGSPEGIIYPASTNCISKHLTACSNLSITCPWASISIRRKLVSFFHEKLSPCKQMPISDPCILSLTIKHYAALLFFSCTSDSKTCLPSSPKAFLLFYTPSSAILMDTQSMSVGFQANFTFAISSTLVCLFSTFISSVFHSVAVQFQKHFLSFFQIILISCNAFRVTSVLLLGFLSTEMYSLTEL